MQQAQHVCPDYGETRLDFEKKEQNRLHLFGISEQHGKTTGCPNRR